MALTRAIRGPTIASMFTELSYVKEQLSKHSRDIWKACSKSSGVPFSTIKRIAYKQTAAPRSDTVGKIATYFKTREKRSQ